MKSHGNWQETITGSLLELAKSGEFEQVPLVVRNYGIESGKIWQDMRDEMPKDLVD